MTGQNTADQTRTAHPIESPITAAPFDATTAPGLAAAKTASSAIIPSFMGLDRAFQSRSGARRTGCGRPAARR